MEKKFETHVQETMEDKVRSSPFSHPQYKPANIRSQHIDEERQRAAFVLFEQIDVDNFGWHAGQYRHSVWYVEGEADARQLYEDHAYLSVDGRRSPITNTLGRSSEIDLYELVEDGVIAGVVPKEAEGSLVQKVKVKISLDGKVEEIIPDFSTQAQNYIQRVAPKLGYDWLSQTELLEGRDVAAIAFDTENGSTYGYTTIYLVWKEQEGKLRHLEVTNSRSTKDNLGIREIREEDDYVLVNVNGHDHKISRERLNP
jgi:hypothetical protein|tara:strand:+ start:916 stop:1683 length:768 start_codon:yes stop_codon:yes gene_type:complete